MPESIKDPERARLTRDFTARDCARNCSLPIAPCMIFCKRNTCRGREPASLYRNCRWAVSGTHSWSRKRPAARFRPRKSIESASRKSSVLGRAAAGGAPHPAPPIACEWAGERLQGVGDTSAGGAARGISPRLRSRIWMRARSGCRIRTLRCTSGRGRRASTSFCKAGRGQDGVSIAAFLRLGLPGEHFQIALQQERTDLPRFRRFGSEVAFTRGWGFTPPRSAIHWACTRRIGANWMRPRRKCGTARWIWWSIRVCTRKTGREVRLLTIFVRILESTNVDAQSLIDWVRGEPSGRAGVRGCDEVSRLACAGSATLGRALRSSRISFADSAGRCDAVGHSRGKNERLDGRFEMKVFPENNRLAAIWFEQLLLVGVTVSGVTVSSAHPIRICSLSGNSGAARAANLAAKPRRETISKYRCHWTRPNRAAAPAPP